MTFDENVEGKLKYYDFSKNMRLNESIEEDEQNLKNNK